MRKQHLSLSFTDFLASQLKRDENGAEKFHVDEGAL